MACHCPVLLIVRGFQLFFALIVLAVTSDIVYKFFEARQLVNDLNIDNKFLRDTAQHIVSTPQRIYLGLFVSIWTIVIVVYLIFAPRWRNAQLAPYAAIIGLEIITTGFWLCASIGLALFTAEVEVICLAADEFPILRKIVEDCVIMKSATGFAALSWLLWFITWITVSVQACRSRRNKSRAPIPENGLVTNTQSNWTPVRGDMSKAEQGVFITTVEMQPR